MPFILNMPSAIFAATFPVADGMPAKSDAELSLMFGKRYVVVEIKRLALLLDDLARLSLALVYAKYLQVRSAPCQSMFFLRPSIGFAASGMT